MRQSQAKRQKTENQQENFLGLMDSEAIQFQAQSKRPVSKNSKSPMDSPQPKSNSSSKQNYQSQSGSAKKYAVQQEDSQSDHAKMEPADLLKSIAERRKKRELAEQKIQVPQVITQEFKKPEPAPKKSKERGWYRVEGIVGHRINKKKSKDNIELKVKWEGYSEPTWEIFSSFVKDTAPMVERYLIRKSLLKTLQEYQELNPLKVFEIKAPQSAASTKASKNAGSDKASAQQSMAQTPKGAQQTPVKPTIVYKEVCCCQVDRKPNAKDPTCGCLRRKAAFAANFKDAQTREASEKKQQQNLAQAQKKAPWKHIVMKVRSRKRMENGEMGNIVHAINMLTDEKCSLLVSPKMIDEQDLVGLQGLLRKHVELAASDVSIYLQISENVLKKKAKAA